MEVDANPSGTGPAETNEMRWLLDHPGTSDWLKQALRTAESCDPVVLLGELPLIERVLTQRARDRIDWALGRG